MTTNQEIRRALFDLEDVGLEITPTIAMQRGEQVVHQCAWCGAVVVWHQGGFRTALKDCPACDRNQGWWEQRLPVAGLNHQPTVSETV